MATRLFREIAFKTCRFFDPILLLSLFQGKVSHKALYSTLRK